LGLVGEVMIGDCGTLGRPLGRPCQQVRYLPLQHRVGAQPDGVADAPRFKLHVDLRIGKGGVGAKQQSHR
jgi:hypothetical protein